MWTSSDQFSILACFVISIEVFLVSRMCHILSTLYFSHSIPLANKSHLYTLLGLTLSLEFLFIQSPVYGFSVMKTYILFLVCLNWFLLSPSVREEFLLSVM